MVVWTPVSLSRCLMPKQSRRTILSPKAAPDVYARAEAAIGLLGSRDPEGIDERHAAARDELRGILAQGWELDLSCQDRLADLWHVQSGDWRGALHLLVEFASPGDDEIFKWLFYSRADSPSADLAELVRTMVLPRGAAYLNELLEHDSFGDRRLIKAILRHKIEIPAPSLPYVRKLVSGRPKLEAALAEHPSATRPMLLEFARSEDPKMLISLARSPLARKDRRIRARLLLAPAAEVSYHLLKDGRPEEFDPLILPLLSARPDLALEILETLPIPPGSSLLLEDLQPAFATGTLSSRAFAVMHRFPGAAQSRSRETAPPPAARSR
jgi:hypothetical protein